VTTYAHDEVVRLFLAGADVIGRAVAEQRVGDAWDRPSVLEEQTVGSLAGHLARGSWIVATYLEGDAQDGPADFDSAAQYFATFADTAGPELHRAIRERGAAVAARGQAALLEDLRQHLAALTGQLEKLPADHLMAVLDGKVIRLGDYLVTRIVEQAVHLDDLARSVGADSWELPARHAAIALAVGVDIGRLRCGASAVLRAVYRQGFAPAAMPVL
jgi:hypothetical protein